MVRAVKAGVEIVDDVRASKLRGSLTSVQPPVRPEHGGYRSVCSRSHQGRTPAQCHPSSSMSPIGGFNVRIGHSSEVPGIVSNPPSAALTVGTSMVVRSGGMCGMRKRRRAGTTAWRRGSALGALIALIVAMLAVLPLAAAQAATGNRVDLRVLVFTSGDPSTAAIVTALGREGVPYTTVNLSDAGRATIDAAFLANAAAHEGKFQAIVLPNAAGSGAAGLTAAELDALAAYERGYGVRQVDSYDWPGSVGPLPASYSGTLDGSPLTVTPSGLSGPFSYLNGSLAVDNFDPSVTEVYGYPVAASPTLPAGSTFTPLLNRRRRRRQRSGRRRLQPRLPRGTGHHRRLQRRPAVVQRDQPRAHHLDDPRRPPRLPAQLLRGAGRRRLPAGQPVERDRALHPGRRLHRPERSPPPTSG